MEISLLEQSDLESAIILSLKCESGFWGERLFERPFGSLLHTLSRSKRTQETLDLAHEYVRSTLKWLIEDGFCEEIEVKVFFDEKAQMKICVACLGMEIRHIVS